MCVSVLADFPGRSIVTTSTYMYTPKLELLDEIRTHGQSNFENKFLDYLLTKLEHQIFRETTVLTYFLRINMYYFSKKRNTINTTP